VSECEAKRFPGDDGLFLGQIGQEYTLVDWFSSNTFGVEWSMFVKKCRKRCIVRVNKIR